MSLRGLSIDIQYRTDTHGDLGVNFISPMLEHAVIYKRAVGFFSSSALLKISRGLSHLIQKNNSKVQLVVSPRLSKEDVEAIEKGYKSRKDVVEESLLREFIDAKDKFEEERFNYLSHLIELKLLDIKIADTDVSLGDFGMYHEKFGIIEDENGDKIGFSGSLNESDNAYTNNFESILVFKSWVSLDVINRLEDNFKKLWDDKTHNLKVYDFPEAVKKKIFKYRKPTYVPNVDEWETDEKIKEKYQDIRPEISKNITLYDYQKTAINNWAKNGYKAIFNMGTGTGKTFTAFSASVKLLERICEKNGKLATIILCPQVHIVEQWVQDQKLFNINFIVGYSKNSKYKNYKQELKLAIKNINDGIIDHFYFITTNDSYSSESVQEILSELKTDVLFIGDEVHNLGAKGKKDLLNEKYKYRLGLSATIDRHGDEEGTAAIYDYFGQPCIKYDIDKAIANGILTKYYYYSIFVYLNEEEQEKYKELTEKIIKASNFDSNGEIVMTKSAEKYALERARIVAVASDKINALREVMKNHSSERNLLVYCGTGKVSSIDGAEIRQIDEVCRILGNEFKMNVARYTSEEDIKTRLQIAERFKSKDDELQALVAMKCLDEGVNIPCIKTAFILASSTNPREYVQRRGRVLRKFEGKSFSYIYDFVTLPFKLEDINNYSLEFIKSFKALVRNEVNRIKEFASSAINGAQCDNIIDELTQKFELNKNDNTNEIQYEKIEWEEI